MMVKVRLPLMIQDPSTEVVDEKIERFDLTEKDETIFLDGPISRRVAVLDFDEATGELHPGVPFQPPKPGLKISSYKLKKPNDYLARDFNAVSVFAAVLDTGLRTTHVDFAGRVVAQVNFTDNNGGDVDNAKDGDGHGTNVGGIIVANGDHEGIAPGANIIPIKVLSHMGIAFPAILREGVSVGAVYDDFGGPIRYGSGGSGARASSTAPDRLTPFSQRLHETIHAHCRTDIFAPGAPIRSAGINNDHGESTQHGTSQAAPVVAGVILLMQQLHHRLFTTLPEVADLTRWMRDSAVIVNDGDDEADNVPNTGLDFPRIDAFAVLEAIQQHHTNSTT
jgi:hypothetical protein